MISASSINTSINSSINNDQAPSKTSDPSDTKPVTEEESNSQVNQKKSVESSVVVAAQAEQDKQVLTELKTRDQEVRAHEAAHKAAGGPLTGAASYSYKTGPDGNKYATGGEVPIDTGKVANDPEATVRKAQIIRAAALAPASPSAQDRAVAAQASAMAAEANGELIALKLETGDSAQTPTPSPKTESTSDSASTSESEEKTATARSAIASYQTTAANNPGKGHYLDQLV